MCIASLRRGVCASMAVWLAGDALVNDRGEGTTRDDAEPLRRADRHLVRGCIFSPRKR
jgi:hypothetical protein